MVLPLNHVSSSFESCQTNSEILVWIGLVYSVTPLSTIFHLYVSVSFIGGENRSTRRK